MGVTLPTLSWYNLKAMSLTDKQERFCLEYVVDFNSAAAAERAGYSVKTARQQGSRLLTKVDVQQRVRELARESVERVELSAEMVLKNLIELATKGTPDSTRVRAWELLGKHLAMFTDRVELTQIPDKSLVESWIAELEHAGNGR